MNSEQLLERVFHCIESRYAMEAGLYARLLVRRILAETGNDYLEHHASYCQQCSVNLERGCVDGVYLCELGQWIWERESLEMQIVPW